MITSFESNTMKAFQVKRGLAERSNNIVQSFINNISFPKTLDELYWFAEEHGCYPVEDILQEAETVWTSPRWAKIGDIVFFMHSKTAKSTITKLRTQLYNERDNISKEKFKTLIDWINRGLGLYKLYGGKIFAIGEVIGAPQYISDFDEDYEETTFYHWGSRIYAEIEVSLLDTPIDISEYNDFILVSRQSGITPVFGKEFIQLKELICSKNDVPQYFMESEATPLPLTKINSENWLGITEEYRRSFMLEAQFRSYYVDYLLRAISDRKTIYKECRCVKQDSPNTFADNVIYINGKYLPVEVKLSIKTEANIKTQVENYCNTDEIYIDSKRNVKITPSQVYNRNVMIIDTDNIYIFDSDACELRHILCLNDLTTDSDLKKLKSALINALAI
ncbi:MAG: hypothetical protein IJF80_00905 [Clostridia bacterium]|nr:hypothetical protein [Clostridia bacterium]